MVWQGNSLEASIVLNVHILLTCCLGGAPLSPGAPAPTPMPPTHTPLAKTERWGRTGCRRRRQPRGFPRSVQSAPVRNLGFQKSSAKTLESTEPLPCGLVSITGMVPACLGAQGQIHRCSCGVQQPWGRGNHFTVASLLDRLSYSVTGDCSSWNLEYEGLCYSFLKKFVY